MTLKPLVLALAVLGIGCSSSNNTDSGADGSPLDDQTGNETVQFSEPDLNGASDLARLSYPVTRDLSRELVTGAYLNTYYDIDDDVRKLISAAIGDNMAFLNGEIPEGEWQGPHTCPEGGTISALFTDRNGPNATFTAEFEECSLEGRTLSGSLERYGAYSVTGGGSSHSLTLSFDDLTIDAGDEGTLVVNGSAERGSSTSTAENLPEGERGSCILPESNRTFDETSMIESAIIEHPGLAGTISISASSYVRDESRIYNARSNDIDCTLTHEYTERGNAGITFEGYGDSVLSGQATVTTSVDTNEADGVRTHTATQMSELPDASTVTITALSSEDCSAQVDILAGGSAISFDDNFCFVAEDF